MSVVVIARLKVLRLVKGEWRLWSESFDVRLALRGYETALHHQLAAFLMQAKTNDDVDRYYAVGEGEDAPVYRWEGGKTCYFVGTVGALRCQAKNCIPQRGLHGANCPMPSRYEP